MMNHLKCSVENCANYLEHQCCLSQIDVAGPHAENRQETCCDSFRCKDNHGTASNSVRHDVPNPNLQIRCTAEKCVHNHQGDCHADCVCVGIGDYDTVSKQETQCETFSTH